MTDAEAITQVDAMKAETIVVRSEVTGAQADVDAALDTLQDVLDNVSASASDMQSRVLYMLNNHGG